MKKLCKNLLPVVFITTLGLFGRIETVYGQPSSLHDSLRQLLMQIEQKTNDTSLRKLTKEIEALYTSDAINDSLSKKLLVIDSTLIWTSDIDKQIVVSYAETLVQLFKEFLPKNEHPDYAFSLNNLALLYTVMGQYDKALPLFLQALSIRKKLLGENHLDYARSLSSLAYLYQNMGQYDKALPLSLQALSIRKKLMGENHLDYARSLSSLAYLYQKMGQYDKALPLFLQALSIQKKLLGENHLDYARSLSSLAYLYQNMEQYDKALPLFLQALSIQKKLLGENHLDYARSLNNLAYLYQNMGQYDKALPLFLQALSIQKKLLGENHLDYAFSLNNLALLYTVMGQYDKALPLSLQALSIYKKLLGENHLDYATSLNSLALLYTVMGQYDKALPLSLQALSIYKKLLGENHLDYAGSLNNLAYLYQNMGQYDKALSLYLQGLSIRKKLLGENHLDYAFSLGRLASLYQNMGQYDKALPLSLQALSIYKKLLGENHLDYATSLYSLALLYTVMGQYDKALPLSLQALSIYKKLLGENHLDYATSLYSLALLYTVMGQYDKALPLSLQALSIYKKLLGENHLDYAFSLHNLASLYMGMGQDDKALPLFLQALSIQKKLLGENHLLYAVSLGSPAFLYMGMGQYDKALPLFLQALSIQKKLLGEEHPDYATSLNSLAILYADMEEYDKALPLFLQALSIRKKLLGENHPDYAIVLYGLGTLHYLLGNPAQASTFLVEAFTLTKQNLKRNNTTLSEQEKIAYLNKHSSQFDLLPSLLFTQSTRPATAINQLYSNELVLKSMVLEDQKTILNNIRKSRDSNAIQIYDQWRFYKTLIGKQLLLPIKERLPYLDSLHKLSNLLEQQLSQLSTAFRSQLQSQTITVKDIAQKLQKDQAAIEFIRFPNFNTKRKANLTDSTLYAALLLLPKDSTIHFVPLCEEKQLRQLLTTFTGSDSANNGVVIAGDVSDSLYKLVWKPLQPYLTGVQTVYYAPTGLLHRISFQSLRPDSAHYLIDKVQLNQVLSTRSLALPSEAVQKPQEASLWGDIDYGNITSFAAVKKKPSVRGEQAIDTTASAFDFYAWDTRNLREGGWNALPRTKSEVDNISKTLLQAGVKARTNIGKAGTEEAFKALDGNSPQVVHLATHGFFLPVVKSKAGETEYLTGRSSFTTQQNPMFRSGLVLAGGNYAWTGKAPPSKKEDGILTAYEIAQMDLQGTDLVVMSACGTALGDLQGFEGVIGLQRAFKLAGVKQMLISLWPVDDKATMELMTLFYRHWLQGQTTREALRKAQLEMKKKYSSPYYWAAFVLIE